jgi:hypothetical protein
MKLISLISSFLETAGKCIGKRNMFAFHLFIWALGIQIVYVGASLMAWTYMNRDKISWAVFKIARFALGFLF